MPVMPELNVDTQEMAVLIANIDATAAKFKGGIEHLGNELSKVQGESEQSVHFRASYTKIITESQEAIIPKIEHSSSVLEEFRQQVINLENDPNIFATALSKMSDAERSSRAILRG